MCICACVPQCSELQRSIVEEPPSNSDFDGRGRGGSWTLACRSTRSHLSRLACILARSLGSCVVVVVGRHSAGAAAVPELRDVSGAAAEIYEKREVIAWAGQQRWIDDSLSVTISAAIGIDSRRRVSIHRSAGYQQ